MGRAPTTEFPPGIPLVSVKSALKIVKDDKWKELFENYVKEKTQSDIHQDVSGSGYVQNSITNQFNKPRSKKASQVNDSSIDDLLQEI